MEDYIVIILTLLIAVASAFNRKKKKNAPATPASDETKQASNFWDMLMEEQGLDEQPAVSYVEEEPDYDVKEPRDEPFSEPVTAPSYDFKAAVEGQSGIGKEMKSVEKKRKPVFIDGEEFSLKKAVIYSEILNRKYT